MTNANSTTVTITKVSSKWFETAYSIKTGSSEGKHGYMGCDGPNLRDIVTEVKRRMPEAKIYVRTQGHRRHAI